jgi:hypothetical protein
MADLVNESLPVKAPPAPAHRYLRHFRIAWLALAALALVAVIVALVIWSTQGSSSSGGSASGAGSSAWSSWQPSASGDLARVEQIANHVAPLYRLDSGQIASVTVMRLAQPGASGQARSIPVYYSPRMINSGSALTGLPLLATPDYNRALVLTLCRPGSYAGNCGGYPIPLSPINPLVASWREMYELALYTLRYAPGVDTVMVVNLAFQNVSEQALFLRRENAAEQLSKPLAQTLPGSSPIEVSSLTGQEMQQIAQAITPVVYTYQTGVTADGSTAIVLSPLGASTAQTSSQGATKSAK